MKQNSVFKSLKFTIILISALSPLILTQNCIRSNGSICLECDTNFYLVNGICLDIATKATTANPNLLTYNATEIYKLLQSLNASIPLISNAKNASSIPSVSVIPLNIPNAVGNYYQININNSSTLNQPVSTGNEATNSPNSV